MPKFIQKYLAIAAAAIVVFTACSKTESQYLGEKEIGFRAINSTLTKATVPYTGDLGVYAWNQSTAKETFPNTQFTLQNGIWRGVTPQYWPGGDALRFTVYAPFNCSEGSVGNGKITNAAVAANVDFLYGSQVYESTRSQGAIPVTLKHAKTLVKFNASCELADLATVESITLNNAAVSGGIKIDYSALNPNPTITWTKTAGKVGVEGINSFSVPKESTPAGKELMIIPNDSNDLTTEKGTCTIVYKLKGQSRPITVEKKMTGVWEKGKRYIYNLHFSPDEISFKVEVEDWADEPAETIAAE